MSKAKRLTDSNKWDDPWFMELENDYKLVWFYLLDKCDHAGIYKINLRLLNFHTQANIKGWATLEEAFGNRLVTISEELCFIPKFLKFQYHKGLNTNNNCLKSVRDILTKHNLNDKVIELFGSEFLTLDQGLNNPSPRVKEKEKEKEKEEEIGKNETLDLEISKKDQKCEKFIRWYNLYDKKINPKKAYDSWSKLKESEKDECLKVVKAYVDSKPDKSFRLHPTTYLNNRGWEDEIIPTIQTTTTRKKGDDVNGWFKNK